MSHVRKLRSEYPDRFHCYENSADNSHRLNSWDPEEEALVINTVNKFLEEGKSLSNAISELEKKLSRTQGAIYQRIYTLRRKQPEKFKHLPVHRPRRRRSLQDWPFNQTSINSLYPVPSNHTGEQISATDQQRLTTEDSINTYPQPLISSSNSGSDQMLTAEEEEEMVLKAFEKKFGRPNNDARSRLIAIMRKYGTTRVSIAMFTLTEDKAFPSHIVDFLERRLLNKIL
ncbi:hypothetical protein [Thermoactinomyces mirandus]|uniref:Uncharacterized protein n=1 Tax=Thermoactinomyces mirandus TaxID=2756294 RepID=A0A7W1XQQ9_9BACL|nr:hypothetical protein [Thermoactinomyces mirandus]MBA4601410.1 hypothetical protein [Thermoactinomyces mirandus]